MMVANNSTNFGGILLQPVALLGYLFRMVLSVSLTDALTKRNKSFCKRFSLISFNIRCFLYE